MYKILKKYKFETLTFLVPFIALSLAFLFYTYVLGLHIYGAGGDYYYQHLPFYDYVRESFYQTQILFPQMNMRHGGISSFANLVYYGSMNPFIWLSYLFPFISMQTYFELLTVFLIPTIALLHFKILDFYKFDKTISFTTAVAFSIVPSFIFHLQGQVPFALFYPFFLLSVWSVQKLERRFIVFILAFSQIYYLNFTFAAATAFFLFLYMLILIHSKKLNHYTPIKYIVGIIVLNLISLLIGFLPFIVQVLASSYRTVSPGGDLINKDILADLLITNNPIAFAYDSQLYLYTMIAFSSIFFIKKFKESYLMIFLFFALLFMPITKSLNFFLYFDPKIYIYFTPFIMIAFTYVISIIKSSELKQKIAFLLILNAILFTVVVLYQTPEYYTETLFLIMLQNIIILTLISNRNILFNSFLMFVMTTSSFFMYSDLSEKQYTQIQSCGTEYTLSRTSEVDSANVVKCSEDFTMTEYSSILNENLTLYTYELYDNTFTPWYIHEELFEDEMNQQILSINADPNTNPFIKGVNNSDIYIPNKNKFTEADMITHVESESGTQEFKDDIPSDIADLNEYNLDQGQSVTYDLTQLCTQDSYIDLTYTLSGDGKIKINDIEHDYGVNLNNSTFQNTIKCNDVKSVTFVANSPLTISNISINVYTLDELNSYSYNYSIPYNVDINFNESINFDIDMIEDGMLTTTIPYDKGFNIYVDGQEIETTVANQYFLAAPISSGTHSVSITFTMPGFYLGITMTIIGIILTLYLFLKYI